MGPVLRCHSGAEPASTRLLLFLTSFSLTVRDEAVPATAALLDGTFPRAAAAAVGVWFDATLLTRWMQGSYDADVIEVYLDVEGASDQILKGEGRLTVGLNIAREVKAGISPELRCWHEKSRWARYDPCPINQPDQMCP